MDEAQTTPPKTAASGRGKKILIAVLVIIVVVVAYYLVSRARQWWYTGNSQLVSGYDDGASWSWSSSSSGRPVEPLTTGPADPEPAEPEPVEPHTRATVETTRRRGSPPRFAHAKRADSVETEGFFGCGYDGCRRGAGSLGAMTSRLAWIGDSA